MSTEREQAKARDRAEVAALRRRIEDGTDYRIALDRLHEAEARGDPEFCLAMYRLMVAVFAPMSANA